MAIDWDLYVDQGCGFDKDLEYLNPDDSPIVITDWTFQLKIRKTFGGEVVLHISNGVEGGITLDEPNGKITFVVTDAQSAALPAGTLFYELRGTPPGGGRSKSFVKGKVFVSEGVI